MSEGLCDGLVLKETGERMQYDKESVISAFGNREVVISDIHPSPPVEGVCLYRNIGYHWNIAYLHFLREELNARFKFWGKSKSVLSDLKRVGLTKIKKGRKDIFREGDIFIKYSLDPYTAYVYLYAGKDAENISKWAVWESELLFPAFLRYVEKMDRKRWEI